MREFIVAQRDYVSKKHGRLKKGRSSLGLIFMIVASVIVIFLFIAVLYTITQQRPHSKPLPKKAPLIEKPDSMLPEKPQERWSYLKKLENPENDETKQIDSISRQPLEREEILNTFRDNSTAVTVSEYHPENKHIIAEKSLYSNHDVSTSMQSWFVQCGAFKDKRNAESLKARIAMAGFDSQIQRKTLYRVIVGADLSKEKADETRNRLKALAITNCITNNK